METSRVHALAAAGLVAAVVAAPGCFCAAGRADIGADDVGVVVCFQSLVDGAPPVDPIVVGNDVRLDVVLLAVQDLRASSETGAAEAAAPFALDLDLASPRALGLLGATPGRYSRVAFDVEAIDDGTAIGIPAELYEEPGGRAYSIRVLGSVADQPFDWAETQAVGVDLRKASGIDVDVRETATFDVRIDLARWFEGLDLTGAEIDPDGVVYIDDERNGDLAQSLREALLAPGVLTVEGTVGPSQGS